MQKEYQLPAGAMLYAVYLLHKRGIYGLPPAMPRLADKEFPAFAQASEEQLLAAGLASLDFSGTFTLSEDFATLLAACADCTSVVGASLRSDNHRWVYTLYPAAGAVLCRDENNVCTLSAAADPAAVLMEALSLPEGETDIAEAFMVDSDHLEKEDREAVLMSGCGETAADMVLSGFAGSGHYSHVTCTRSRERVAELVLLYGEGGILRVDAEYTLTQELLRFSPLNIAQTEILLRELVTAANLPEEPEEEPEDDTESNGPEEIVEGEDV